MTAFLFPVTQQIKSYFGLDGEPLQGGYIFFGVANQDPRANPIQMFWDVAGTIPAAQPFRTVGGYITRNGTPANVFASGDFSSVVLTSAGALVYTVANSTDLQLALAVTGTGTAAAIPIVDAGGFYTAPKNVESVLQQVASPKFVTLAMLADVVAQALNPTGTVVDFCGTTAPAGWVLGSGRTIGNGSSGGTERANADTSVLYTQLWNSSTNTELPIQDSTGTPTTRGASASNDFAANKRLPLPDCRSNVRAGKDNMGGTAANRITVGGLNFDATVMFKSGGAQNIVLTTAQLAAHNHGVNETAHTHGTTEVAHNHNQNSHVHTTTQSPHNHTYGIGQPFNLNNGTGGALPTRDQQVTALGTTSADSITIGVDATTATNIANSTGLSVNSASTGITTQNAGSGNAHINVQPTMIFTVIIKL